MTSKEGHENGRVKNEAFMRAMRRHRMAKGLSLEVLAKRLNVATSTAQAWESGRNFPRPQIVPKLARILEIDPLELTKIMDPEPIGMN